MTGGVGDVAALMRPSQPPFVLSPSKDALQSIVWWSPSAA